jgi:hypothetical protein
VLTRPGTLKSRAARVVRGSPAEPTVSATKRYKKVSGQESRRGHAVILTVRLTMPIAKYVIARRATIDFFGVSGH